MTDWDASAFATLTAPQEVGVVTRRRDGTVRRPRTIWIVGEAGRVFIRSTNGPSADWYRWAVATGIGQMLAGSEAYDVQFVAAAAADLPLVDRAYRTKYGRYAGIVDHLVGPEPRSATLEVRPA